MKLRVFWAVSAALGVGLSWVLGDSYYAALQLQVGWRLMGSGPLWDSSWVARSIEASEGQTPEERLWSAYNALKETALFEKVQIYYTGTGGSVSPSPYAPAGRSGNSASETILCRCRRASLTPNTALRLAYYRDSSVG